MGQDPREIEGRLEETREHMGDTVAALSHKADVPGRVKESVSGTAGRVTDKLGSARDAVVGGTASSVGDGTHRAVGIAQSNPLGLAVGAMAVGFVVGTLLPETRMEEERIGPIASQVREQVGDVAQEAIDHGKDVAHDVIDAAATTAQQSGKAHAESLQESAKETLAPGE